jgi:hypothetical protein
LLNFNIQNKRGLRRFARCWRRGRAQPAANPKDAQTCFVDDELSRKIKDISFDLLPTTSSSEIKIDQPCSRFSSVMNCLFGSNRKGWDEPMARSTDEAKIGNDVEE